MMNEIPELKNDYAFLKKFDSRVNAWLEIGDKKNAKGKPHSNFLLHPKRLTSDSESSEMVLSPRKNFSSTTVIKSPHLNELNNNEDMEIRLTRTKFTETRIINVGSDCLMEDCGRGDSPRGKCLVTTGEVKNTKKAARNRPNTCSSIHFDKKYTNLVEKSLKLLKNIGQILETGVDCPDGEEDFTRRVKRLQEFSARFSRNYVYPLLRQMDDLSTPERMSTTTIHQKMLCAQQVILNGLQAYYNHLPSSVGKCCSDKLKSVLDQILLLCQLYYKIREKKSETNEFVNILKTQTEFLIETVNTFDLKILEKNRKALEPKASSSKKKLKQPNKIKNKLSMYATSASFRKDLEWRKAVESFNKKKFNVKSRYKTSLFKHRPPVEKPQVVSLPSKTKMYQIKKQPSPTIRISPIREDDIKTMVELDRELAVPPNSSLHLNHENSNASSRQQLVRDSNRDTEEELSGTSVRKALEVLKKFFVGSTAHDQGDILDKMAEEIERKKDVVCCEREEARKKYKEPTVTVTGAKNAKLICIRDDNSVVGSDDEEKKDKEIMTDVEVKMASSETQTDLQAENRMKSRSAIKISRLPKSNRKVLQLLPKNYAISIIQYKLRYAHFHKENPLYRKSASVQPWMIMSRISDDILDYILQSVAGELEVNEILENLYNSEFQY